MYVNFLAFNDPFKAYKGLEAYNHMVCGLVRETQYQLINDRSVVKAKVSNAITSLINLTYSKCFSRCVLLVQPETRQLLTIFLDNVRDIHQCQCFVVMRSTSKMATSGLMTRHRHFGGQVLKPKKRASIAKIIYEIKNNNNK